MARSTLLLTELDAVIDHARATGKIETANVLEAHRREWFPPEEKPDISSDDQMIDEIACILIADGNEELADALRDYRERGGRSDYDSVDAAYIFSWLLTRFKKWNEVAHDSQWLRGAGQLEEMAAMWNASLNAAQALTELVHEEEWNRLAVFAYEMLDDGGLSNALWDDKCENPRQVVIAWMKMHDIRFKDDGTSMGDLAEAKKIIKQLLNVGDDMRLMGLVHQKANDFLEKTS